MTTTIKPSKQTYTTLDIQPIFAKFQQQTEVEGEQALNICKFYINFALNHEGLRLDENNMIVGIPGISQEELSNILDILPTTAIQLYLYDKEYEELEDDWWYEYHWKF